MQAAKKTMHKRSFKTLAASALLASLAMLASTDAISKDFYRWTDENGTTHYSSLPPTDKPSEKVHTSNIKGNPTAAQSQEPSEAPAAAPVKEKDNFDESASAPETTEAKAQRKENCKRAKFNLKTLKEKPRIRVKEGDDYRYIDQKERKAKIKASEKAVKQYCK